MATYVGLRCDYCDNVVARRDVFDNWPNTEQMNDAITSCKVLAMNSDWIRLDDGNWLCAVCASPEQETINE